MEFEIDGIFVMGFVYTTALIKYLIMGYKFPDGPLASNM